MGTPNRGEIWLADLGLAAKTRPVLIVSVPYSDEDYALIEVIPHTTQTRNSQFEVSLKLNFLETGAFNLQGMLAVPAVKFIRPLGRLTTNQMQQIESALKRWLGLQQN